MKKFVFTLERMLAYQEQNLEKERAFLQGLWLSGISWRRTDVIRS